MDKDDLKTNRFLLILLTIAIAAVFIIAISYFLQFGSLPNEKTSEHTQNLIGAWGTVGDYFGGTLNPILAFCSLIALCYTIDLQNKQLKKTDEQLKQNQLALEQNKIVLEQNAKALEFNNQELKNSTRQLEISAQAQAEMEKTQKIQQFEGLFTYMANELSKIYGTLNINSINAFLRNSSENTYSHKTTKNLIRYTPNVSRFCIYLYQTLKLIDKQDDDTFSFSDKKKYSNIIRSSLDDTVLQLVFLNNLVINEEDLEFHKYKKILENYKFFEHMSFDINLNRFNDYYYFLCLTSIYDIQAFGNNIYLKNLPVEMLRDRFYHKSNYNFISQDNLKPVSVDVELNNPTITLIDKNTGSDIISFNLNLITDISSKYKDMKTTLVFSELRFIYQLPEHQLDIVFYEYDTSLIYRNLMNNECIEFKHTAINNP